MEEPLWVEGNLLGMSRLAVSPLVAAVPVPPSTLVDTPCFCCEMLGKASNC